MGRRLSPAGGAPDTTSIFAPEMRWRMAARSLTDSRRRRRLSSGRRVRHTEGGSGLASSRTRAATKMAARAFPLSTITAPGAGAGGTANRSNGAQTRIVERRVMGELLQVVRGGETLYRHRSLLQSSAD